MKSILTYYAGKQKLAQHIVNLIPTHLLYSEPFLGGGAVFFLKPPSHIEVLNDINGELINFYQVVASRFDELKVMVDASLYSRRLFNQAIVIYHNADLFDPVRRAWAVWILCNQSFASKMDTWGYDRVTNTNTHGFFNKRNDFISDYARRLEQVQLECSDALYIIRTRDAPTSFFFCDPPYFNSSLGPFKGYSESDFNKLLNILATIKGKFLLSSYDSRMLEEYTSCYGWTQHSIDLNITVHQKKQRRKKEIITTNYIPCQVLPFTGHLF